MLLSMYTNFTRIGVVILTTYDITDVCLLLLHKSVDLLAFVKDDGIWISGTHRLYCVWSVCMYALLFMLR